MDLPTPFLNAALLAVSFITCMRSGRESDWFAIVDKRLASLERRVDMEGNTSSCLKAANVAGE